MTVAAGGGSEHRPAYRVLGPMEVTGARGPLRLQASRQRIVLAMLLLEANHVLTVERLVDAVWDDDPPPTAKAQIQICVSAIRRALTRAGAPGTITTRSPGYLLQMPDDQLDLNVFARRTAQARELLATQRVPEAVAAFRSALALWYGEPLAGLESRLVQRAAVQIGEQLLTALEECLDAELRLGRHHTVVGELMRLVDEYPLRDRLRAHLMLALYRSGRQAEALAVYRQARQNFAEELGLEPGNELRRLERAILTADADLEMPAPDVVSPPPEPDGWVATPPRLLPADIPDFAGRQKLLGGLRDILLSGIRDESGGAVPVVAVAGPGGVGKTTLAVHLAHSVRDEFPDGQLYAHLHGAEGPVTPVQTLGRFLRAFGVPGSLVPDGLDERAELYRNRVAGRRMLVVLDDAATEEDVVHLLPGSPTCAVIITSRLRLTGLPGARLVNLDMLDEDAAVAMLTNVIGPGRVAAEPHAALELVELCGRLPLAIRIAAARLAARAHWPVSQLVARLADERQRLDELVHRGLGVRPTLTVAYQSLPADARLLFRLLGATGLRAFPAWLSAALLDRPLSTAEDLLESIVDIRLLEAQRSGAASRYQFHDLIRLYAAEQAVPAEQRRAAVTRLVGGSLFLAEQAHQRLYGGDFTVLHGTAPRWQLPAAVVDDLMADPLEWFETERPTLIAAVRQAAELDLDELCWDLAITLVGLFESRHYLDDWRETHAVASAVVARTGNRRGQAAMTYSLGALATVEQRFTDAQEYLVRARDLFAEVGDTHGRALALRHLAYLDRVHGDFDAALMGYEEALSGLRAAGDKGAEAHLLGSVAQIHLERRELDAAAAVLDAALDIAREIGSTRIEAQVRYRLGEVYLERGELDRARQAFDGVLRLVVENADLVGQAYARYGLGVLHLREGELETAQSMLERALRLARDTGERLLTGRVHVALAEVHQAGNDLRRAVELLVGARKLFEELGAVLWCARTMVLLGEVYRARRMVGAAQEAFAEADRLLPDDRAGLAATTSGAGG